MAFGMAVLAEFLIAINVVICVLVILLGYLQKRYLDVFSVLACILMCGNGVLAVLVYGGTELFPASAAGVTSILLIHGAMVHFPLASECTDRMMGMQRCPAFRIRYVCNHETWVLVAATAGLVSAFRM